MPTAPVAGGLDAVNVGTVGAGEIVMLMATLSLAGGEALSVAVTVKV